MKAIIIYRDFVSAANANGVLLKTASNPALDVRWSVRPWRVDMLKFPPTASEALCDAQDAHIIVFAGACVQTFPFWLQDWLEQWAQSRLIADPVLAAICNTTYGQKTLVASEAPDLHQFAVRHGLRVIFDDSGVTTPAAAQPVAPFQEVMADQLLDSKPGIHAPRPRSNNPLRQEGA